MRLDLTSRVIRAEASIWMRQRALKHNIPLGSNRSLYLRPLGSAYLPNYQGEPRPYPSAEGVRHERYGGYFTTLGTI